MSFGHTGDERVDSVLYVANVVLGTDDFVDPEQNVVDATYRSIHLELTKCELLGQEAYLESVDERRRLGILDVDITPYLSEEE